MIAFLCSSCGAQLRVKDELAGVKGKCPRCGQPVEAPHDAGAPLIRPPSGAARATPPPNETRPGSTPRTPMAAPRQDFDSTANVQEEDLACLAPPQAADELGRLGPYRIQKILGAGGMGIVFQAEDVTLKRKVALKAMRAAVASSAEHRQRFQREAEAAAALDHDHIVTIYQVGEDRGIPYLAMKLLLGESLEDRLNRKAPLPTEEVLRISQEIAEGLAVAHERGLIHRDIKPANIWLEEGRDRVKIVDFGLARAWGEDTRVTQTGYMVGTPAYMAPEQAEGEVPPDHRADLFSLGCVMYRMATGELPFKGKSTMAVLLALATKNPRRPRELNPDLPRGFDKLVMRLLEKAPADRPQSARAIVAALSEILEGPAEADYEEVPEALEEAEEEAREEQAPTPSGKRKKKGRKKQPAETDEAYWERMVLRLAVVVGVGVFLLIAFLIGRSYW